MPQLPAHPNPAHTFLANPSLSAAHPNAAHTSLLDPSLAAHPNPAHTAPAAPFQAAHPNPANTFARSDCAKFAGAFPCAIGIFHLTLIPSTNCTALPCHLVNKLA